MGNAPLVQPVHEALAKGRFAGRRWPGEPDDDSRRAAHASSSSMVVGSNAEEARRRSAKRTSCSRSSAGLLGYHMGHAKTSNRQAKRTGAACNTESSVVDEVLERCDKVIDELWPELKNHIIRKEPYGAKRISSMSRDVAVPGCGGEAVGLAQVVGQCGRSKPDPRGDGS